MTSDSFRLDIRIVPLTAQPDTIPAALRTRKFLGRLVRIDWFLETGN